MYEFGSLWTAEIDTIIVSYFLSQDQTIIYIESAREKDTLTTINYFHFFRTRKPFLL